MNIKIKLLIMLIFISCFNTANASVIRIGYEGTVSDVSPLLVGGPINIGDSLSGYYIIDTEQSTANIQTWGDSNQWSQTFFEGALQESFLRMGSEEFTFFGGFIRTDPNTIGETAYSAYTRQGLVSATSPQINSLDVNSLSVNFSNFTEVYPLDVIPLSLPLFDPINNPASTYLRFTDLGNDYIRGNLASVSISSVPLPVSAPLMAAGLFFLGLFKRYKNITNEIG